MEINVYGPLRLSQVLAPLLGASKDGRIVNVSSGMGAIEDLEGTILLIPFPKLF
ncbi:MAG: hypothetical protein Q8934_07795 [Bacillota bacterium]|nr:hypothetical protein [Bacillota bacterium]